VRDGAAIPALPRERGKGCGRYALASCCGSRPNAVTRSSRVCKRAGGGNALRDLGLTGSPHQRLDRHAFVDLAHADLKADRRELDDLRAGILDSLPSSRGIEANVE